MLSMDCVHKGSCELPCKTPWTCVFFMDPIQDAQEDEHVEALDIDSIQ